MSAQPPKRPPSPSPPPPPRPRPPPRYYRPSSFGWTPRTPTAPHTPRARIHTRPPPTRIISKPTSSTPSWLKGSYRQSMQSTVQTWCKERLESIKQTVDGTGEGIPELKKVMEELDSASVAEEILLVSRIRREYWKARERQRKALAELHKAERDMLKVGLHAEHIEGKIARLRGYARFIEGGWVDEKVDTT